MNNFKLRQQQQQKTYNLEKRILKINKNSRIGNQNNKK